MMRLRLSLSLSLWQRVGVRDGNQSANDSLIVTRGTRSLVDAAAGVRRQLSRDRTARARGSFELISVPVARHEPQDTAAGPSFALFRIIGAIDSVLVEISRFRVFLQLVNPVASKILFLEQKI